MQRENEFREKIMLMQEENDFSVKIILMQFQNKFETIPNISSDNNWQYKSQFFVIKYKIEWNKKHNP